jgi:hypothetical protein
VQLVLRFAPARVLGEFGAQDRMTTMIECPNPPEKKSATATPTC